jgi:hypothetical protein
MHAQCDNTANYIQNVCVCVCVCVCVWHLLTLSTVVGRTSACNMWLLVSTRCYVGVRVGVCVCMRMHVSLSLSLPSSKDAKDIKNTELFIH